MTERAVFLDKDGTLLEDVPYNVEPARMRLLPGSGEGLRLLHEAGFRLIVISNQSGVARGLFSEAALLPMVKRLHELLAEEGVPLAGFYYCPHHPAGNVAAYTVGCSCRKPQPGMIVAAAEDHAIDLPGSWMVGDILDDVEAGNRAGCRTVLLDNGHETEWLTGIWRRPDHDASDLLGAARFIVKQPHSS